MPRASIPLARRGQQTWCGAGDAHGALHRELPHRAGRAPAPRTEGLPRHLRSGLCRRRPSLRRSRAPAAWTKLLIAAFVAAFRRRACPLRRDLGPLRRSCRRHFRSRHRQGLLHRGPLRQGERRLQGRASPRSTAICSAGAICSMTASISAAAYASSAFCRSSGRPSTRCSPWPAQEPGKKDAGRSIRPLTLPPGIRGR